MTLAMSELTPRARALRVAHVGYAAVQLAAVAGVWTAAITKRRHRFLGLSVAAVCFEAAALVAGRGECPLGPVQERAGDPDPIFELFLPSGPARQVIPLLGAVTTAGLTTVALHWPLDVRAASRP